MDELQDIWQAHQGTVDNEQQFDAYEIKEQLKGRTNDALRKINKVMRLDLIMMTIVTSLFILVTFILKLENRYAISTILFGMMMLLGVHYWIKHYLINKYNLDHDNIADIITKQLRYLKWNEHIYIYGIPVLFLGCYLYFQEVWTLALPMATSWHLYTLGILLTGVVFICSKMLYKLMYGRQIKALEEIIDQLNQ